MRAHRHAQLVCLVAASLQLGIAPGSAAPSPPTGASPLIANTATPSDLIFGHAVFDASSWHKHLQLGLAAIDKRNYEIARAHLSLAVDDLRKHNINDARAVQTRVALAQACLGEERLDQAQRLFVQAADRARELHAPSLQREAQAGLAETLLLLAEKQKAGELCKQLLSHEEAGAGDSPQLRGNILMTAGSVYSAEGLAPSAVDAFKQALVLFQRAQSDRYLLSKARYRLALELQNSGHADEAQPLFERAFADLDREVRLDAPLNTASRVVARWDNGSPRSRVIADPEYPLKYLLVGDLRVAATAIRSENVVAVLISLANCGSTRLPLCVGPVNFVQLAPHRKDFLYVPASLLDLALEEEHVTELTWRRRWLNHIEKNRFIPGYLKNRALDVDNFFSNNTFGEYGNWPTLACNETPIVTREEFYHGLGGRHGDNDAATVNFLSRSNAGQSYQRTFIDPGDAKTGLVFFKQERFDHAQLNINIGNTVIEIPIDTEGPRR